MILRPTTAAPVCTRLVVHRPPRGAGSANTPDARSATARRDRARCARRRRARECASGTHGASAAILSWIDAYSALRVASSAASCAASSMSIDLVVAIQRDVLRAGLGVGLLRVQAARTGSCPDRRCRRPNRTRTGRARRPAPLRGAAAYGSSIELGVNADLLERRLQEARDALGLRQVRRAASTARTACRRAPDRTCRRRSPRRAAAWRRPDRTGSASPARDSPTSSAAAA